ncbi:predicted protein [Chaetomium globosum CBS 148.51]|uniref:Uncharacterized protein n=1 Tax=Chaetomium globosum (strain ATCC 6205 / CBS 148.51 / DSM 1962 / NBRC 6347 / NRRL 1970) TaxID=306901 RepID=Q2GU36_CHAGB|nr:uncharacterized protein CHGG_08518 [Chaetomium globosum CBS 148.51]EAQ84504.1 predicted protein [Chaetomium globosum CBS 148.51]
MDPSGGPQGIPVDDLIDGLAGIKKMAFKAAVAVFFALAILSVLVRAGFRLRARQPLTLDDYLVFAAAILLSGGTGLLYNICDNLYLSSAIHLDQPITLHLGSQSIADLIDAVQGYRSYLVIAWTAISLAKFSFLAFFRQRIGDTRSIRLYYWSLVALTAISWLLCVVEPFILCPNVGSGSSCFADSDAVVRASVTGLTTALDILTIVLTLITTLALTTASFSAVRASKASTGTDLPQTAFWLALQASSALLAVGLGTFSRSLLGGRGVVEGGNLTGEGDIQAEEARGIQGRAGKVRLAGLWGLVKGVEGRDGQEVSQLGTVVVVGEEADGVPPLKEKVGAREEVRQTTSSPVPRNPPIAYHYPMWGPQPTHGQFATEDEARAGQDLIWLNPSLQASQTSFGSATLYERRGSERRGSERRGSERRGSEPPPVAHVAKQKHYVPTIPLDHGLVPAFCVLCPTLALVVEQQHRLQDANAADHDYANSRGRERMADLLRLPEVDSVPVPVQPPVPDYGPAPPGLVRPEMDAVAVGKFLGQLPATAGYENVDIRGAPRLSQEPESDAAHQGVGGGPEKSSQASD